ncbi:peptidase dimerization domain protein [Arcobacter nitrofigilis DSM 7299]|uniref:Peptidase dimerization domain protein n=1 Tax=Arcobacter nitrofigilis (strain ATCC 33309 / DSM 7299 / CCUG 15893 / LMG 7604 / NCTC 12251 / CI) TaxID=572480 RepID=D5UZT4_ARCNC|nr:M20 family metallopeptidase [Arcobacter nitrofigilis]ADG93303.1 peptidase dimerization domain protein [Arcobacter nitrofigilis DSM 7299]
MNYILDLKQIININSYTKNKTGVDKIGAIMSSWLKELGFEEKTYTRELLGNHQLFKSSKKAGPKILLLGHNDTVFPPNTFEEFSEDELWVYGPGVCDMKGGNIVALQALRNIFKTNKEIFNIDFLLVSDEESGSDDSKLITSSIAKNYDLCFVFEAAGEKMEVVTQRKGVGTFTITIEGKASHAGNHYDKGIDANLEASYKLQELVKLTNLELQTTVNVGKINGGIGANTISPKCELLLEIRYTSNDEKQRVLDSLEKITNNSYVSGTISILTGSIQRDVMQENANQLELIKKIEKITNSTILSEKRGGVSDANIVASCGVTTLDGFGPFGDGDHTIKERALKSSFQERIDLMTNVLAYFQNNI